MSLPPVVSREEWLAARRELLAAEKRHTRERDAVAAERRRLPMVRVDERYAFEGPGGDAGLLDLFEGRSQLVVYHFMWRYVEDVACPSCSAFVDQIGHLAHLHARDTTFAAVSRAPFEKIEAFRRRMGWTFPWWSSLGSDFNFDYHVTFDESVAPVEYNYLGRDEIEQKGLPIGDWEQPFDLHGLSVFLTAGGEVFHTYSAYARGTDHLGFMSNFLDLTPLGRQEEWEEPKGRATALGAPAGSPGVRYHDEY
ncbi:MAG TPA: DUF899 domain-containing protein [Thermoleophilaceae bacterium]|jgi:predicted dithiol-disulfide oxidoreductase (DUF899 family)